LRVFSTFYEPSIFLSGEGFLPSKFVENTFRWKTSGTSKNHVERSEAVWVWSFKEEEIIMST
jgi:hypothetical protein